MSGLTPRSGVTRINRRGFTLIELLVVIGVVGVLAAVMLGALNSGESAKLQTAQLTMTNLVTNARSIAQSSGRRTRILVHADIGASQPAGRFLQFIAVQQKDTDGLNWTTIRTLHLPDETFVVPLNPTVISGLIDSALAGEWAIPSSPSSVLGSTLFAGNSQFVDLMDGFPTATFQGVQFTERGTLAKLDGTGWSLSSTPVLLLVASGRAKAPGAFSAGTSPVELSDSNKIRGAYLSVYAVPFMLNDKQSL